jgi:hypothetical protein
MDKYALVTIEEGGERKLVGPFHGEAELERFQTKLQSAGVEIVDSWEPVGAGELMERANPA